MAFTETFLLTVSSDFNVLMHHVFGLVVARKIAGQGTVIFNIWQEKQLCTSCSNGKSSHAGDESHQGALDVYKQTLTS